MPFLLGWHFLFHPINPHFFHRKGHKELLLTIPEIDKNTKHILKNILVRLVCLVVNFKWHRFWFKLFCILIILYKAHILNSKL